MKHIHHIIPKHRGGSDDPSNLVEVSLTQHMMFHWCEWQRLGLKEDLIAWKFLSGTHPGGWNRGMDSPDHSERMKGEGNPMWGVRGESHPLFGRTTITDEGRRKISDRMKNNNPMNNPESRQKISQKRKGKASKIYQYKITFKNGTSIIITNLKEWCATNNHSYVGVLNVKSGKSKTNKDIVSVVRV